MAAPAIPPGPCQHRGVEKGRRFNRVHAESQPAAAGRPPATRLCNLTSADMVFYLDHYSRGSARRTRVRTQRVQEQVAPQQHPAQPFPHRRVPPPGKPSGRCAGRSSWGAPLPVVYPRLEADTAARMQDRLPPPRRRHSGRDRSAEPAAAGAARCTAFGCPLASGNSSATSSGFSRAVRSRGSHAERTRASCDGSSIRSPSTSLTAATNASAPNEVDGCNQRPRTRLGGLSLPPVAQPAPALLVGHPSACACGQPLIHLVRPGGWPQR